MITVMYVSTNSDEAGVPRHIETLINGLEGSVKSYFVFGSRGPVFNRLNSNGHNTLILPGLSSKLSPAKDIFLIFKLMYIIKKCSPDIVHAHSSKAALISRIACMLLRLPCVVTIHGWGWRQKHFLVKSIIYMVEYLAGLIPNIHYIFVSHFAKITSPGSLKIIASRNTATILNGVDICHLMNDKNITRYPAKDTFASKELITVIMPARVCEEKDHRTFLLAIDQLYDCKFRTIFCGSGTSDPYFKRMARTLAPRSYNKLEFLGQISDMKSVYSKSDIFCLISKAEALPLSILEALSSSLPVIATSVGGVPEIINHFHNGILVKKNSPEELSIYLRWLIDSRDLRSYLSSNGLSTYFTKFQASLMISKTQGFYSHMLGLPSSADASL